MSHEKIVLECLPFNVGQPALAILFRQNMHAVNVNLVELELQNGSGRFGSETRSVRFQDTTEESRATFDGSRLSTHTCLHRNQLPSLCPFVVEQSK